MSPLYVAMMRCMPVAVNVVEKLAVAGFVVDVGRVTGLPVNAAPVVAS